MNSDILGTKQGHGHIKAEKEQKRKLKASLSDYEKEMSV